MNAACNHLLAVDVGLHTGLAFFDGSGILLWYRSHHLATPAKLKKMIAQQLRQPPTPTHIYLEGGGPLAEIWLREAGKRDLPVARIAAETWRRRLLRPRRQTNGKLAKKEAGVLARRVITACGGKQPTALRHDTAEAILIGYYALQELGWIE